MAETKQPLNITINGSEENPKKEEHIFENYVLCMNQKLHKENETLMNDLKNIQYENEKLEEEIEKEEKSKTYMKGLMHNLYDMKQKSSKIVGLRKDISIKWDKFLKNDFFNQLKQYELNSITSYYVIYFAISVIFLMLYCFFWMNNNMCLFFTFIIINLSYIFKTLEFCKEKHAKIINKYNDLVNITKSYEKEIDELKKDIDKTENSCRCLDNYIDEI